MTTRIQWNDIVAAARETSDVLNGADPADELAALRETCRLADVALAEARAQRDAAVRERDAVIGAWPEFGRKCVYETLDRGWVATTGRYTEEAGFLSKSSAVRFLAGLDAAPAEKGEGR